MSPRRSSHAVAACCVVAALIGAGCGAGSDSSAGTDTGAASAASGASSEPAGSAGAAAPGDAPEILRFTGDLVGGGTLDASSLSARPTAFWFWAPT